MKFNKFVFFENWNLFDERRVATKRRASHMNILYHIFDRLQTSILKCVCDSNKNDNHMSDDDRMTN